MIWKLSGLEIYIKISPGTVISLECLAEVNRKSLRVTLPQPGPHRIFIRRFHWRWVYNLRCRYKNRRIGTQEPTIIQVLCEKDNILSRIFWKQILMWKFVRERFFGEHTKGHLGDGEGRIRQKETQWCNCNRSLSYPTGSQESGWPLIFQTETIRLALYIPKATNHWMQVSPKRGYKLGKNSSLWPKANPRETQKGANSSQCTQWQRNECLGLEVGGQEVGSLSSTSQHPLQSSLGLFRSTHILC